MERQSELERLYQGADRTDILKFYDSITDVDDLITFCRNRPKADVRITIDEGVKPSLEEIVVVIPVAKLDEQKVELERKIYGPLTIIFVQSSGPFFNYAHSVNSGIKKALQLGAKWIIVANDDLYSIDPIEKMIKFVNEEKQAQIIMANPGYINGVWYHSVKVFLSRRVDLNRGLVAKAASRERRDHDLSKVLSKFDSKLTALADYPVSKRGLRYYFQRLYYRYMHSRSCVIAFYNFGDFCVFRSDIFGKYSFDETFQSRWEDIDLSLQLRLDNIQTEISPFRIGSNMRSTLGNDSSVNLRFLASAVYFSNKAETLLKSHGLF